MRNRYLGLMSFEPSFEEQELLAETLEIEATRMSGRELVLGGANAAAFTVAVTGLWLLHPPHAFAIVPAIVCFAVLVLAMLVCFDTPFGKAPATQLGFVPLVCSTSRAPTAAPRSCLAM